MIVKLKTTSVEIFFCFWETTASCCEKNIDGISFCVLTTTLKRSKNKNVQMYDLWLLPIIGFIHIIFLHLIIISLCWGILLDKNGSEMPILMNIGIIPILICTDAEFFIYYCLECRICYELMRWWKNAPNPIVKIIIHSECLDIADNTV